MEIYLFTSNTDWKDYGTSQTDILDEIIASVHLFLRMYQHPSGADLQCVLSAIAVTLLRMMRFSWRVGDYLVRKRRARRRASSDPWKDQLLAVAR